MKTSLSYFLRSIVVLALSLGSCSDERLEQQRAIQKLEAQQVDSLAQISPELMQLYNSYIETYPEDSSRNASYLYRLGTMYYHANKRHQAVEELAIAIKRYPNAENMPKVLLFAGSIYEEIGDKERTALYYQRLIDEYPTAENIDKALFFFKADYEKMAYHIGELEQEIENKRSKQRGARVRGKQEILANAYRSFVAKYPDQAEAPSFAFYGASVALELGKIDQATAFYRKIYEDYPNFARYQEAMLALAALYEQRALRPKKPGEKEDFLAKAKEIYQAFLKKFPDSELADDVRLSMKNLGKDPNDVVKGFAEQNEPPKN